MEQQSAPKAPRPRRWLWLVLTLVLLIALLGGVVLALPPLRQFVFQPFGQEKVQGTPTPTGPWYLAGGGACVKLPATPPKQITNVRVSKDSYLAHSEPEIAENPNNPLNLV